MDLQSIEDLGDAWPWPRIHAVGDDDGRWFKTCEDVFYRAMEDVPPLQMFGSGFVAGEPYKHLGSTPVHAVLVSFHGEFYIREMAIFDATTAPWAAVDLKRALRVSALGGAA